MSLSSHSNLKTLAESSGTETLSISSRTRTRNPTPQEVLAAILGPQGVPTSARGNTLENEVEK